MKRMFTVFISQEPKRIREIQKTLNSHDNKQLCGIVHSLKGAAATLGLERIKDCCLLLEEATKANNLSLAQKHLEELTTEMSHAYRFMFTYLAEN